MSLQDESFPADDLFDKLNGTAVSHASNQSIQRQYSMCLNIEVPDNFKHNGSPYLNRDFSEKTCTSDAVSIEEHHGGPKTNKNEANESKHHAHAHLQLGSGRSSKAVSYQDIHSAYTKRTYKHVTSKVSKYIADIHDQDKQRRSTTSTFQRHRSMPESLTPRGGTEDHQKLDESLSLVNSSGTDTNVRDESYERLVNEKDHLQSYNDYLQSKLYKKINDNITLRKNFEVIRTELTDCKDKLKRQSALSVASATMANHTLCSLKYCPPKELESVATQTDPPMVTAHVSHLTDLSDGCMPAIAANATPHPNTNLNDITYDSSVGSIEVPLLSVPHAVHQLRVTKSMKNTGNIKPLSLNFSSISNEVDRNEHAISAAGDGNGVNMQPTGSNGITTNHSGSSHPSSNDSAIEIENIEPRSPLPTFGRPAHNLRAARDWNKREGIIYIDKVSKQVLELVPLNPNESGAANSSTQSQLTIHQYTANTHIGQRKKSLGMRMLRLFGPCTQCDDPSQMDASTATYTVGIPLLANDTTRSSDLR